MLCFFCLPVDPSCLLLTITTLLYHLCVAAQLVLGATPSGTLDRSCTAHRWFAFSTRHLLPSFFISYIMYARFRFLAHGRFSSFCCHLTPSRMRKRHIQHSFGCFAAFGQDHTCAHCSSTPNVRSPRATSFLYVLQSQPRRKNASRVTCTHVRSSLVHDVINRFKHRSP